MALAETPVVKTVSDGWLQVPFELSMLLEADQLAARTRAERLRREARDDGGGGIAALQDLMATRHGVWMGPGCLPIQGACPGAVRGRHSELHLPTKPPAP